MYGFLLKSILDFFTRNHLEVVFHRIMEIGVIYVNDIKNKEFRINK